MQPTVAQTVARYVAKCVKVNVQDDEIMLMKTTLFLSRLQNNTNRAGSFGKPIMSASSSLAVSSAPKCNNVKALKIFKGEKSTFWPFVSSLKRLFNFTVKEVIPSSKVYKKTHVRITKKKTKQKKHDG